MGAVEEGGKALAGTVDALKTQPMLLTMLLLNILFLGAIVWLLHTVAAGAQRRDQLMYEIARECGPHTGAASP